MSLTLHFHPLSSFCWKALIALYENDTPFTANTVDLGNSREREALLKLSPIGRFPVLEDGGRVIPEATIIIEYLAVKYPGPVRLIPDDPDTALDVRMMDRFFDNYVMTPMMTMVSPVTNGLELISETIVSATSCSVTFRFIGVQVARRSISRS